MFTSMKQKKSFSRRRGSMLADSLLAVGVLMTMILMLAVNNQMEARDQQDRMTAARTEIIANASKAYVAEQYDTLRERLTEGLDASLPGDAQVGMIVSMEELAETGYLSDSLIAGTGTNVFGQEYFLYIRGVLRSDANWPQLALTKGQVDSINTPDANGVRTLINGVFNGTDDEMDLESVLITEGGNPASGVRGANITGHSGNPTMGVISQDEDTGDLIAYGNLGAFAFPMEPWVEMGAIAEEGRFLTLVSLSDGVGGSGGGGSADLRGALRRCEGLANPIDRETCLADGNNMYSNIVFNAPNGEVPYDQYPGIEGVKKVSCRLPDSPNRPGGDLNEDDDFIYIDCGNVVVSEDLTVQDGNVTVQTGDINLNEGQLIVNGNAIANNLIMAQGEGTNGEVLPRTGALTEMCPFREDGTRGEYKVQTWVSGLIEPVGRPIAGYRATYRTSSSPRGLSLAQNPSTTTGEFVVDVISFLNENHCAHVVGGTLVPGNQAGGMDVTNFRENASGEMVHQDCLGQTPDSFPDAFFLNDGQAIINYAVYCE